MFHSITRSESDSELSLGLTLRHILRQTLRHSSIAVLPVLSCQCCQTCRYSAPPLPPQPQPETNCRSIPTDSYPYISMPDSQWPPVISVGQRTHRQPWRAMTLFLGLTFRQILSQSAEQSLWLLCSLSWVTTGLQRIDTNDRTGKRWPKLSVRLPLILNGFESVMRFTAEQCRPSEMTIAFAHY